VGFVDDPEQWRWIWPVGAVAFALGEMATPGSFFLAPFALGAAVAAVLAFADVFVVVEWTAVVVVSVACLLALRRLARRLDRHAQTEGIGSRRLIGRRGTVLRAIPRGAVDNAIHEGLPDAGLIAVKYLETLQVMANGTATTIVVPAELSGLAGTIAGITGLIRVPSEVPDEVEMVEVDE
jgi:membrane protein implicated in regulation of membrane protease activity